MVAALVSIVGAQQADAECNFGRKCTDLAAVELVRAEIMARCDCVGAAKPKVYKKCANAVVKSAVKRGALQKQCKGGVRKCEAKSICGRPGAIVCCSAKGNGRVQATVVTDESKCRGTTCLGHTAVGDACEPDASCAPLVRPFRNVQQVFTQSCALPTCHSAAARQGELVLAEEELSYASLVDADATHEDAPEGLKRVVPGDPASSFLIQKMRGTTVIGGPMPEAAAALPEAIIEMMELWIERGAPTTAEECEAIQVDATATSGAIAAPHNTSGTTVCDDRPLITGNFKWKPEPPLPAPAPDEGVQLYAPQRPVDPGTEWETCVAVKLDLDKIREDMGLAPGEPVVIKDQLYRMHEGSHHMLLYNYFGSDPDAYTEGHFPCVAANCIRAGDCPADNQLTIPIGGTQVAGTRYEVTYPGGVGVPLLGPVVILNLHYNNPFQPAQDIYGEAWVNLNLYKSGEFRVLLDGIFAINTSFVVEPWETLTTSRVWQPRGILSGQPTDAAIFQLFGHMHLRGRRFIIDHVTGGACSETTTRACGRDSDCPTGQTCIRGPDAKDVKIYDTRSWDNAPVVDYPPPYVRVNRDDGLRWTCVHANGITDDEGNEILPVKRCHEGCNVCGWRNADRKCHFRPASDGRIFDEGEPMPLVFGTLADDDMCNMFGYFVNAADLGRIGP